MALYTGRQLVLLFALVGAGAAGLAIQHWRAGHPDAEARLEALDRDLADRLGGRRDRLADHGEHLGDLVRPGDLKHHPGDLAHRPGGRADRADAAPPGGPSTSPYRDDRATGGRSASPGPPGPGAAATSRGHGPGDRARRAGDRPPRPRPERAPGGDLRPDRPADARLRRASAGPRPPGPAGEPRPGPVDLNRASLAQLVALPGVGPALAARILEVRASAGGFASVDDLDRVPGVGPARIDRVRPFLVVTD